MKQKRHKTMKDGESDQDALVSMAASRRVVEYSRDNRFPFSTTRKSVSVCFDDHDNMTDLDFIYDKIVERHPELRAEKFYSKVQEICAIESEAEYIAMLKQACDLLLVSIREFLQDEEFIHLLHQRWGFGIDKVIETLYAVYGYYFYTGKRTANVIKKTIDGYTEPPEH